MPVYLIRAGEDGPCKIGYARSVAKRLKHLQTGHHEELRLIRTWDGNHAAERSLHKKFSHLHIPSEWFHYSEDMLTAKPEVRQSKQVRHVGPNKRTPGKHGYIGIVFVKGHRKFHGRVVRETSEGTKQYYTRGYATAIGAARAYDRLAIKHHGYAAILNFPQKDSPISQSNLFTPESNFAHRTEVKKFSTDCSELSNFTQSPLSQQDGNESLSGEVVR